MQTSLFDKYKLPVKTKETERGELLKQFTETLNVNRIGHFKPMSIARVGMLLAHIPTKDLYYLMSVCKDSGNRAPNYFTGFGKRFYFEIRAQK